MQHALLDFQSGWAWVKAGPAGRGLVFQSLCVALFSGVIATILFFKATDLVKENPRHLAVIEATQCGEVVIYPAGRNPAAKGQSSGASGTGRSCGDCGRHGGKQSVRGETKCGESAVYPADSRAVNKGKKHPQSVIITKGGCGQ